MKILAFYISILGILLSACAPIQIISQSETPNGDFNAPVETLATPPATSTAPEQPVDDQPGQTGQNPTLEFSPRAGDEARQQGNVYIESSQILSLESFPVQFTLQVTGNLPDPCHELRTRVSEPDENGRVDVAIYSLSDPETMCIQVLQPFDINIPLGSFPAGEYQLFLNGEKVADFYQD